MLICSEGSIKEINKDSLSGLYKYEYFLEESNNYFRSSKVVSFIVLSINGFSDLNDTHGHIRSEKIFKSIALMIKAMVKESDIPTRSAANEITISLPGKSMDKSVELAENIKKSLQKLEFLSEDGEQILVTASICITEADYINDKYLDDTIKRCNNTISSQKSETGNVLYRAYV